MVSTPAAWRLPNAPMSLGAQIEAAFALWVRSARAAFPYALIYTLSGLLPVLASGDLGVRLARFAGRMSRFAFDPSVPDPTGELVPLAHAVQAWAVAPSTLLSVAAAVALALFGINGVLLHQQGIAQGGPALSVARLALRRWPGGCAAWALYALVLIGCAGLVAAFAALLFVAAVQAADPGFVALLLVVLLAGSLLLSAPLAWASVAFGYAPVLAALEGTGPLAAHRVSARCVRGHWARAATVVTVPLLVYLGIGSTVSSLAYLATAGVAYAAGGLPALLDGAWLRWSAWVCVLPMALSLPLGLAGLIVSLHDLRQRAQETE